MMNINKIKFTEEEYNAAVKTEKETKNKNVARRLKVIILSYEGLKNSEIAKKLDYDPTYITKILKRFKNEGIEYFISNKQIGNNRHLSKDEEDKILNEFKERSEKGNIVSAKEIKEELDKEIGKETPSNYVYRLLKRHNWRKVMPRRKHPKSASEEEKNSSKKLKKMPRSLC